MKKDLSIPTLAFGLYPYKRNQDVISQGTYITTDETAIRYVSIVDGWNNPQEMISDKPGKITAQRVSEQFPRLFLDALAYERWQLENVASIASRSAHIMDKEVLSWYPAHASCVGTFLFDIADHMVIIAEGTITTLVWDGKLWQKPPEIGDYVLDSSKYPSGAARFFGRGELKHDAFYSVEPDTIIVSSKSPIFVATDGLLLENGILTLEELQTYSQKNSPYDRKSFIGGLGEIITARRHLQKDDISILLKI